jgi:hypothetical protein
VSLYSGCINIRKLISATVPFGFALLTGLAYSGQLDIIHQLLSERDPHEYRHLLRHIARYACIGNHPHVCIYVLHQYPGMLETNYATDVFNMACLCGMPEVVRIMLQSCECSRVTGIGLASYFGHLDVIQILIPNEMNNKAAWSYMWYYVCYHGHIDVIRMLIPHMNHPNFWKMSLFGAYAGGHIDIFNYLVSVMPDEINFQEVLADIVTRTPYKDIVDMSKLRRLVQKFVSVPKSDSGRLEIYEYIMSQLYTH